MPPANILGIILSLISAASWGGGDFGAGLLQADEALKAAASKYK